MKPYEDPALLKELFTYNAETGKLFRAKPSGCGGRIKAGSHADTALRGAGYRGVTVMLDGKQYRPYAHRIAWILHHGKPIPDGMFIDHINGAGDDNRIANLRLVTQSENQHNQRKAKGCGWHKATGKWQARIRVCGRMKTIGYYATEEEAHAAYLAAKRQYHPSAPTHLYH